MGVRGDITRIIFEKRYFAAFQLLNLNLHVYIKTTWNIVDNLKMKTAQKFYFARFLFLTNRVHKLV